MRSTHLLVVALTVLGARTAQGQQRDTTTRTDSAARADSIAREDSLRIVRELERLQKEPRQPTQAQPAPQGTTGPINPRLLPDVSAVGDLIGDITPSGTTQEDGSRFGIREVEVALQAAVDPYFRGDIFFGVNDLEKVSIEQAYLTATALPWGIEARLGRFLMPVGKQNTTHRHDLHTVEYPWVIQSFFGPEGLTGTGIWVSKIFAPFGFYQELQATVVDRFGDAEDGVYTLEPVNKELAGLGYSLRFRNYWDLSEASNIELSASAITGRHPELAICGVGSSTPHRCAPDGDATLGIPVRQSVVGGDFTYRWRPLQQGLYKSFILQLEWMTQLNGRAAALPPMLADSAAQVRRLADRNGFYAFARYQLTRRTYLGARIDRVAQEHVRSLPGGHLWAHSAMLEFFPSEFSKLMVAYEHVRRDDAFATAPVLGPHHVADRLLLQASFAIGPHKPHPF